MKARRPIPSEAAHGSQSVSAHASRAGATYAQTAAAAIGVFLLVRARGEALFAPEVAGSRRFAEGSQPTLASNALHVLFLLVTITSLAKLLGLGLRRFHQPPEVSEMIAGVMLGLATTPLLRWIRPEPVCAHGDGERESEATPLSARVASEGAT